jgi:hypothetical protein
MKHGFEHNDLCIGCVSCAVTRCVPSLVHGVHDMHNTEVPNNSVRATHPSVSDMTRPAREIF